MNFDFGLPWALVLIIVLFVFAVAISVTVEEMRHHKDFEDWRKRVEGGMDDV